jgi:microcystin-dependent protein
MSVSGVVGQMALFPYGFAPRGWAPCNGQLVPTHQNVLFSVIGNRFGGDGIRNFALPNMNGRAPVMVGGDANVQLGKAGGEEFHVLTVAEVPGHSHAVQASTGPAAQSVPLDAVLATTSGSLTPYQATGNYPVNLNSATLTPSEGSHPHENRSPFFAAEWCIAIVGLFPPAPADAFLGELVLLAHTFYPESYFPCDGRLLPILQYPRLYSVLGTQFGGDGHATFGLPDLRGRLAIGQGQGSGLSLYEMGDSGGTVTETLTTSEIPSHTHVMNGAKGPGNTPSPMSTALAEEPIYSTNTQNLAPMDPSMVVSQGGGGPHNNMMPFLGLNWVISSDGVFPSRG